MSQRLALSIVAQDHRVRDELRQTRYFERLGQRERGVGCCSSRIRIRNDLTRRFFTMLIKCKAFFIAIDILIRPTSFFSSAIQRPPVSPPSRHPSTLLFVNSSLLPPFYLFPFGYDQTFRPFLFAPSRVRGFQTWPRPRLYNQLGNASNRLLTSHLYYDERGPCYIIFRGCLRYPPVRRRKTF